MAEKRGGASAAKERRFAIAAPTYARSTVPTPRAAGRLGAARLGRYPKARQPSPLPAMMACPNSQFRQEEQNHPPLANVLLTLVQKMGVETGKFQDATGTLTGLV